MKVIHASSICSTSTRSNVLVHIGHAVTKRRISRAKSSNVAMKQPLHGRTWENSSPWSDAERRLIGRWCGEIEKVTGQKPSAGMPIGCAIRPERSHSAEPGFVYHIDEPSRDEPFIVKLKGGEFVTFLHVSF